MSKDLLLNSSWDIVFQNGDMVFTDIKQSLTQRIKQKLSLFQGEWFLNTDIGLPFFEEIFIKGDNLSRIESIYIREIKSIEGVAEILSFNMNLNNTTRKLSIEVQIVDGTGELIELEV